MVSPKLYELLGKSHRGHGSGGFSDKVICGFVVPFGFFFKNEKWKELIGMGLFSLVTITFSLYFHFDYLLQFQPFA